MARCVSCDADFADFFQAFFSAKGVPLLYWKIILPINPAVICKVRHFDGFTPENFTNNGLLHQIRLKIDKKGSKEEIGLIHFRVRCPMFSLVPLQFLSGSAGSNFSKRQSKKEFEKTIISDMYLA